MSDLSPPVGVRSLETGESPGSYGKPARCVAWFHCFAGIAGDMALGSLVDAGADPDEVRAILERLGLPGWDVAFEPVMRGGVACTAAIVSVTDAGSGAGRAYRDIVALVENAHLPARVTERSLRTFELLAATEGRIHGCSIEDVHFHEVGAHDAIVDVVGTAAALEVLDVDHVSASAVATGTGTITTDHGVLPNPSPATVRLLQGVPTYGRRVAVELTTPTGAALLAALGTSFGPLPAMRVTASGFGAGKRELDELPNCTQVVLGTEAGERDDRESDGTPGQPVLLLEATVDDVTGEQLAHAVRALLEAGAHDAWISPVVMKKGRPGHTVHVLADPARATRLRAVLRSTTGTFGVRGIAGERWPTARSTEQVVVEGEPISMKVTKERAKPEFDDVERAAEKTRRTLRDITSLAEEAWRRGRRT